MDNGPQKVKTDQGRKSILIPFFKLEKLLVYENFLLDMNQKIFSLKRKEKKSHSVTQITYV